MRSHPRYRTVYALLLVVLGVAAGCTALPPVFPGRDSTAAGASELMTERMQTPTPVPGPAMTAITGTVTYRQRIALPSNAVVEVKLQDVSRADAPAILVASQTIETQGKQVPIPYSLGYDPSAIDPRMTYAVSARITVDGKLRWISTTMNPVLTRGAPANNVEIVVEPVGAG